MVVVAGMAVAGGRQVQERNEYQIMEWWGGLRRV